MDADSQELARRLFVLATEIAEAAHDAAVAGQAGTAQSADLVVAAEHVSRRGAQLVTIGRTILIALDDGATAELAEPSD